MSTTIAGRIYPAKSARLELIDLLKEQMHAGYQPADRASVTRPILDRIVADLEHAVQLLDALQDERDKTAALEGDTRWAVNVLLETIAAKFEANDTWDIWRSDAAAVVRSFKHSSAEAA